VLIVAKPTLRCNAACAYCSSAGDGAGGAPEMTAEVRDLLVARAVELGRDRREPTTILWHGGEPLLRGAGFFAGAARRARACAGGARLRHEVQTNLTLLTPPLAAALRDELGVRGLGTSFDPFSGHRRLARGGDYQAAWRAGYRVARAHGLQVGGLLTIDRALLGRVADAYVYYRNFAGEVSLRVNAVYPIGRGRRVADRLGVTAEEWGEVLVALRAAWERDGRPGWLHPVSGWVAHAEGRPARLSCDCGHCPGDILAVGPTGHVYQCGRALDAGLAPLGHLADGPLAALCEAPARRAFAARRERLRAGACRGCAWFDACGGGCAVLALAATGSLEARDPSCAGRRRFLDTLARPAPVRRHADRLATA
jgi:uncharacterized protein